MFSLLFRSLSLLCQSYRLSSHLRRRQGTHARALPSHVGTSVSSWPSQAQRRLRTVVMDSIMLLFYRLTSWWVYVHVCACVHVPVRLCRNVSLSAFSVPLACSLYRLCCGRCSLPCEVCVLVMPPMQQAPQATTSAKLCAHQGPSRRSPLYIIIIFFAKRMGRAMQRPLSTTATTRPE